MIYLYMHHDDTWVDMEKTIGKIKEHNIKVMDRRSCSFNKGFRN